MSHPILSCHDITVMRLCGDILSAAAIQQIARLYPVSFLSSVSSSPLQWLSHEICAIICSLPIGSFCTSATASSFKAKISDTARTLSSAVFGCSGSKLAVGEHVTLCILKPPISTLDQPLFMMRNCPCDRKNRTNVVRCKPGLTKMSAY